MDFWALAKETAATAVRLNRLALIEALRAETAQILLKLPLDLARVFQGILLFCVLAGEVLSRYRLRVARA